MSMRRLRRRSPYIAHSPVPGNIGPENTSTTELFSYLVLRQRFKGALECGPVAMSQGSMKTVKHHTAISGAASHRAQDIRTASLFGCFSLQRPLMFWRSLQRRMIFKR